MSGLPAPDTATQVPRPRAIGVRSTMQRLLRNPLAAAALIWLTIVIVAAIGAPWLAPYGSNEQDLYASYATPSLHHLLGADQLGRDILSRLMYGGRASLLSVLQAVLTYALVGMSAGLVAGYVGGRVDRWVMRSADVIMAIPVVVVILVVLSILSNNVTAAMLVFGFLASPGLVRIVRSNAAATREEEYVRAAELAGLSRLQVLRRHVLPRAVPPALIQIAIVSCTALLIESGVNFLGLGIQPPAPSWGGLVADAALAVSDHSWLLLPTGGMIVLTACAFGIIGDSLRDATADRSALGARSWRSMITQVARSKKPAVRTEETSATSGNDSVVRVRGLTVFSGDVELVRDVNLDVGTGEIVGLVGESGCGKSVTMASLTRLLAPGLRMTAAEISISGQDMVALSEREVAGLRGREIGFIPQEPVASLDPVFTVGNQLMELVRRHRGETRREAHATCCELLRRVRLPDVERVMGSYPHELSGGMAQRVAIARALAGEAKVLIADEPTTALDVTVQEEILDLLRSLRDKLGISVILVTHDWGVVADICDRAVVMYAGHVVEEGPVRPLFANARHPYTRALLDANPAAAGFRERLRSIPGVVPAPAQRPRGCAFQDRCNRRQDDCNSPIPLRADTPDHAFRCLHPEPTQAPANPIEQKEQTNATVAQR